MAESEFQTQRCMAAWHGMITMGALQAGQTVLLLDADRTETDGARMVAAHHGANLIAHVREDVSTAGLAGQVLVASAAGLRDTLFQAPGDTPVDMVVDCTGGDIVRPALRCLKWLGVYVSLAGEDVEIPANYPLIKGLSVIGIDQRAMLAAPSAAEQKSMQAAAIL